MKIIDMGKNLQTLEAPKTRQDVIMLLEMACAEMDIINSHLKGMLDRAAAAIPQAA
jgi:hypothetical protein